MSMFILSDEGRRALAATCQEWMEIAMATGPASIESVRPSIQELYALIDLAEPEIVRCASPMDAYWKIIDGELVSNGDGWLTHHRLESMASDEVNGVRFAANAEDYQAVSSRIRGPIWEIVGPIHRMIVNECNTQIDALYGVNQPIIAPWFWGCQDAFWIAQYYFLYYMKGRLQQIPPGMAATCELARNGFWMFPMKKVCFISDRPEFYRLNSSNELHCPDGPAIQFTDGFKVWAIEGIALTEQIVMRPETLTGQQIIDENNVEIRRIMIERLGIEPFLKSVKAQQISVCSVNGRECLLYQYKEQRDDEPVAALKVINATSEPDGSYREYWLRVPPWMIDALEAVAWTFEMQPHEYRQLNFES